MFLINLHIDAHPIKPIRSHPYTTMLNSPPPGKLLPKQASPMLETTPQYPYQTNSDTHPLKFHPQQCIYMDISFIPPTTNSEGMIEGNTVGSGVYIPNNNTQISERLLGYQNKLRAELNAILIAIKNIQIIQ